MLPLLSSRLLLAVRIRCCPDGSTIARASELPSPSSSSLLSSSPAWPLLLLVARDPGDLALLALRVVAAAVAALYVPTTFASSPQRADPHAATHGVPTCPPQAHATAGASRVE